MGSELTIDWGNLDRMLTAMQTVGDQAAEVDTYFSTHVCSSAGFDYDLCALKPIGDQLPTIAGWFTDMRGYFDTRWVGVVDAVQRSARDVDMLDGDIDHALRRIMGGGSVVGPILPQNGPLPFEAFEIAPITDSLTAPGDGDAQLPGHDKEYTAIADAWDTTRDTINAGINKINSIIPGEGIPTLQYESLDNYVVYPLSGNYRKLQGNAAACTTTKTVMADWGMNFTKLSGKVTLALQGDTEVGIIAQLNLYNLVMRSIGVVIGGGAGVFNGIARMSERIAIRVEKALVVMGKKLLKLLAKITSRLAGVWGWMLLAKELLEKGLDAVMDLYHEAVECIEMIDACFDLVDEIRAWAEEQAAALETFNQLVDIIKQLPETSPQDTLESLAELDLKPIEDWLAELDSTFSGVDPSTQEDLDEALEELV